VFGCYGGFLIDVEAKMNYPRDKKGIRYVQVMNPETKQYSVIEKQNKKVVRTRKSAMFPYEGVKIVDWEDCTKG
jgi:hypothetical protein